MATHEEVIIQHYYREAGIWMNFGYTFPDIKSAKNHIKNITGKFRFFKRTVTEWKEVKDADLPMPKVWERPFCRRRQNGSFGTR